MDRAELRVSVAYSPQAGELDLVDISVNAGATVGLALSRSGLLERHPGIDLTHCKLGVWGQLRGLEEPLRDLDRIEIYRQLQVDPKEARRLRYRSHRETLAPIKRRGR